MYSNNKELRQKTTRNVIGRKEFIENLVEEFHTTTNIEAQEQITANLANFAFDPINYQYLREAAALHLFFQLLSLPNERLVLHGAAGICNICTDPLSRHEITKSENIKTIFQIFQTTTNTETSISLLTIFYLLAFDDKDLRSKICVSDNLQRIHLLTKSSEERVKSLATVIFEDFATPEIRTNV